MVLQFMGVDVVGSSVIPISEPKFNTRSLKYSKQNYDDTHTVSSNRTYQPRRAPLRGMQIPDLS